MYNLYSLQLIYRTSSVESTRSKDSGVSDCDLHDKMVSILHLNNNRKVTQEGRNYKITKQRRTRTNTTFRDQSQSQPAPAITSQEVDSENNILVSSQVALVTLDHDEDKPPSLAARVMSRPFLDIIEELCGDCDVRGHVRQIHQRRISLSAERKINIKQFFCFSTFWGKVKQFLAHKSLVIPSPASRCEHNQLLQIHSKFNHLGPIRLSVVHRSCSGFNTKKSKESVSTDMLWYAYLAM